MGKLYVSNKDESARLFESGFLEFFTHVHWSVPILLFFPVIGYILWSAPPMNVSYLLILFLMGLLVWSLTEYLLHRFVFHYEPTTTWGKRLHFLTHGVHHDYPNDSKRLVMPPSVSIPLATLFYFFFRIILGESLTGPFFAGFLIGYVAYDTIHYATHHAPAKAAAWQWLKHHHIRHHYENPDRGYGVSSPLWDYIFGTMEESRKQVLAKDPEELHG